MKRTSASLKLIARQQLSGNYGTPMAGILLLGLCSFLPSFFISSTMDTGTTMGRVTSQILVYVISLLVSVLKDRKSTRLNSSHIEESRMPSSA